ncbi:hypothetical protein CLOM_g21776 [Closterium sp. NIES-68]|nr:hypothetical protein CLOM_g21776 [Closterium sp. NIES-68]GJP74079.1 hypothetical protein CLOP_g4718 [Closterium sp. NIES-67]
MAAADRAKLSEDEEQAVWRAAEAGDEAHFMTLAGDHLVAARALRNDDGRSAIHVAAAGGHAGAVRALLRGVEGAESAGHVNVSDDEGWTPLMSASSSRRTAVVDVLLKAGADAMAVNRGGRAALHYAASKGHVAIVHSLLRSPEVQKRGINQRDKVGCTPLHRAAGANQSEACEVLLEEGAAIDATDAAGRTPAMAAAECAHDQVVLLLVRHGTNIHMKDPEGLSLLDLCSSSDLRKAVLHTAQTAGHGTGDTAEGRGSMDVDK